MTTFIFKRNRMLAPAIALALGIAPLAAQLTNTGEYNTGDVEVINNIIATNGLALTPWLDGQTTPPSDWAPTRISWDRGSVENLYIAGTNLMGTLDVSGLTALKELQCGGNNLSGLNVSGLTMLEELNCINNSLSTLDVSGLTALEKLYCINNSLSILDVSGLTALKQLYCSANNLGVLDVSGLTALENLYCINNSLSTLNVSGLFALKELDCSTNNLSTLDASDLTALETLGCNENNLNALDVSDLIKLKILGCQGNSLSALDVSDLTALEGLNCADNNLSALDVSGLTALATLRCQNNNLTDVNKITGMGETLLSTGAFTFSPQKGFYVVNSAGYNVPAGDINTAITAIDVSGGVFKGTTPYTYSIGIADPAWLSIDPATGVITGTRPGAAQTATTATVTVTDNAVAPAVATMIITVGAVNDPSTAFISAYDLLKAEAAKTTSPYTTIKLGGDITDGDSQLTIARSLTLDLNGHDLTIAVTSGNGIKIAAGVVLTIMDSSPGTNKLAVTNGLASYGGNGNGAGINTTDGTLIIESGTVQATGGDYGAGIGGGFSGAGGNITITGGTVVATGGTNGAGIGGGYGSGSGNITINGTATVTASGGGSGGAGIGGGDYNYSYGPAGNILITGENTKVKATGGFGAQDIGRGNDGAETVNVFVAIPQGQLKNSSGNIGNAVLFTADPASNTGTVTATLPMPFNAAPFTAGGVDNLLTGLGTGTGAKTMSVITTLAADVTFALSGYTPVSKNGTALMTSGAAVAFLSVPVIIIPNPDPDPTIYVTGVRLNLASLEGKVGDDGVELIATVSPRFATDRNVRWSTSDPLVATVTHYGLVNFVGPGTATITVITLDGDYIAECVVTVGTDTGTEGIDSALKVYFQVNTLYVSSPAAETIEVYSFSGERIFSAKKGAGEASFTVPTNLKAVIVRGSSGWTKKMGN